jgi:hypothetical protein
MRFIRSFALVFFSLLFLCSCASSINRENAVSQPVRLAEKPIPPDYSSRVLILLMVISFELGLQRRVRIGALILNGLVARK